MSFTPSYSQSHALIIGINEYKTASPLGYAVNDASSMAEVLEDKFNFKKKNIVLLIDKKATKKNILSHFLKYATAKADLNSRLLFFFAGHGETTASVRGEVGHLVPYDGNSEDLSTLIRWDELTRNSDLIPAKHILFIMDACYGGLAITRTMRPGAMRFLRDMLFRRARQVVTAGKADEAVADHGGPIPHHSVFTGHLLEGLGGKAVTTDGVITANGLMAYVYDKVGQDAASFQTPHYGHLDGDGDFIFSPLDFSEDEDSEKTGEDSLIAVPYPQSDLEEENNMSLLEKVKEYLDDPSKRIKLHDIIVEETRSNLVSLSEEEFPVEGQISEDLQTRMERYEGSIFELGSIATIMAFWASSEQNEILLIPFRHLSGRLNRMSGNSFWLAFRWYPLLIMTYMAGIGSIASSNYENFRKILHLRVAKEHRPFEHEPFVLAMFNQMGDTFEQFKQIEGLEKKFVPANEYLFKLVQPKLDDILFLGNQYDKTFDRFEMLLCLEHAHLYQKEFQGRFWGPIGRFGWKQQRQGNLGPLGSLGEEANQYGGDWAPLRAGLFAGSIDRFNEVHTSIFDYVKQLQWS